MDELGVYRCQNCKMAFRSFPLLEKHKDKFCIGGSVRGAPPGPRYPGPQHPGRGSRAWREPAEEDQSPDLTWRDPQESFSSLKAREDMLNERCRTLMVGPQVNESVLDSLALKRLTDEFHKLRMSIEESVPTLRSSQAQVDLSPRLQLDREYRERLQEMSEAHERHLADIQERNRALELQREDIRRRLSAFANQGSSTSHIEQMLLELKTQEEKNQLALDALRDQIGLIQADSRAKYEEANKGNAPKTPEKKGEKVSWNLFPFPSGAGPLSSEISSLHMAYVQNGGSDPAVLAQMRDLQMEAMMFEQMGPKPERKDKKKKRPDPAPRVLDSELLSVEMENQRLEDEILKMKLQRDKRKADDGYLESELADMQREHLQQTTQLQAEIEMLKQNSLRAYPQPGGQAPPRLPPPKAPPLALLPPTQARPAPPMHPPGIFEPSFLAGGMEAKRPHTPAMSKHLVNPPDTLGPAPYDPAAGFVVFYDFLLGLDPTFYMVRLLTGLYSNGQQMGRPIALPAVFCQMGQSPPYVMDGCRGNTAMLSVKQPVPRVRPVASISLVIELQASGGFDPYGQEVQRMSSRGWAKLDLFDRHNQVISGRWKVPVRVLPLKPDLTMGQLNAVPQVGMVELYLRLVNARDADVQAMAEVDPGNAAMYQYPPLISGGIAPPAVNAPPQRAAYPSHASLSLSFPYTDYVDPPPIQDQLSQHKSNKSENRITGDERLDGTTDENHQGEKLAADLGRTRLGFVVDRVKDAPLGDGCLRLTGYHHSTGQVISSRHSGVTCVTSPVKSNIKHGYFIFGEQEPSKGSMLYFRLPEDLTIIPGLRPKWDEKLDEFDDFNEASGEKDEKKNLTEAKESSKQRHLPNNQATAQSSICSLSFQGLRGMVNANFLPKNS
ncbi:coiled-coil domain-containing protein 17 [Pleurodeles waltl]|uniref:coiled-coil domain-containing protein 17 n=1 Tax=Pleurodeles waltl TaxID=8319 RepID=UPI0037094DFA